MAMSTTTKKITASAPTSQPPSAVDHSDSGSGLVGLLFAASQVETKPKAKEAAATAGEGEGTDTEIQGAEAKVASAVVTINSIGGASKEEESSSSSGCKGNAEEDPFSEHDPGNTPSPSLDTDASKTMSFPQILHGILSTPDCQSIVHWLPDGFSFIIADKRRLSDEILPKYFRQALLNSFIRKLNRWGFRRIKSRYKGGESSFANINFIRDKPWLCLKMRCESKPSYHKAPSKNRKKAKEAGIKVVNIPANADVAVPSRAHPSSFVAGGGGTVNASNREFLPAYLPTTSSTLSTTYMDIAANATTIGPPTTAATTIRERERPFFASFRPDHPQQQQQQHQHHHRIFPERQFLIAQMRRDHHLQVQAELQRLHEMSSINDSYVQRRLMMAQYEYERDLLRRNIFHRRR
eukprot:scaffold21226_cov72-Skeletonema_dohrnii-CCMP3373.AAC.1